MNGQPTDGDLDFDRDDPLIEAGLAELLGGAAPPDLTGRIMAALGAAGMPPVPDALGATAVSAVPDAGSILRDSPAVVPQRVAPSQPVVNGVASISPSPAADSVVSAKSLRQRRNRQRWQFALAASVVLVLGAYAATQVPWGDVLYVADAPSENNPDAAAGGNRRSVQRPIKRTNPVGQPGDVASSTPLRQELPDSTATDRHAAQQSADALASSGASGDLDEGESAVRSAVSSSDDADVVAYIDALIRRQWEDSDVAPSPKAADWEWCRRVYLDVLGRIPTADETNTFTRASAKTKRQDLLTRMLDSDEYVEQYARNWTTIWTNVLIGRSGGTEQNSLISREGLQQYLRRSFLRNKPYDQMAQELVGADGSNTPGTEGFNGAVNFVLHNLDENAAPATAKTARIFLGMQVQCTQCHNHPFNETKQNQFWELNAFFRQARPVAREVDGVRSVVLTDGDFVGEAGGHFLRRAQRPVVDGPAAFRRRHGNRRLGHGLPSQPPRRIGPADCPLARVVAGDGQSRLGTFPGLRLHQALRRHGGA